METGPGSLTAPRPNPDLVTVPLTAHPPVHPPLRSRPLTLSPAQTPSQAACAREVRGERRGQAGGPPFGRLLAIPASSAPKGAAKRVPVGGGEQIPFSARPYPRGVTPGSHAPAQVSRWPCPSTPAWLNPATLSPLPLPPLHCPAPADKAPDAPTEWSPPPDPGPAARPGACPSPVPRARTSASRPGPRVLTTYGHQTGRAPAREAEGRTHRARGGGRGRAPDVGSGVHEPQSHPSCPEIQAPVSQSRRRPRPSASVGQGREFRRDRRRVFRKLRLREEPDLHSAITSQCPVAAAGDRPAPSRPAEARGDVLRAPQHSSPGGPQLRRRVRVARAPAPPPRRVDGEGRREQMAAITARTLPRP
ncbi:translation initiation factor IF-2-like [Artibeus jamaicensis]|uniref:translation initiation factor IF-2-like n=1 Tax=Artibeus jamaicensis TaxID=9417 RepID=UPI00235B09E4|nr:translation initiation factor IF-2-like [Artibeus jamaicensis]